MKLFSSVRSRLDLEHPATSNDVSADDIDDDAVIMLVCTSPPQVLQLNMTGFWCARGCSSVPRIQPPQRTRTHAQTPAGVPTKRPQPLLTAFFSLLQPLSPIIIC